MNRFRLALVACLMTAAPLRAAEPKPLVDLVNPFVGTLEDYGQLTPAAVAPFGMVQLGPDTAPANHNGYDYAARTLRGFSHTRAVGVGCAGAGGDLLVGLDYVGAPELARMDKASERAAPGFYHLRYGGGIVADLVATRGGGVARFTLPRAGRVRLRLDPDHAYAKRISATWLTNTTQDLRAELVAGTVCNAGRYRLFTASALWRNGRRLAMPIEIGPDRRAFVELNVRRGDVIEWRTGLSSVDGDGAALVRDIELGARRFAMLQAQTRRRWQSLLDHWRPSGPTPRRALFATSLFRALQTPVAIADSDGRYRGADGAIRHAPTGHQRYASWAMWDNYRTLMPLLALSYPQQAQDIAASLVELYQAGKQRWATRQEPFLTVRTEHSGVALLDFYRKGITFDAKAALTGMAAESTTLARATPDEQIEAAYDDWATGQLAQDLGDGAMAEHYGEKALAYRAMWLDVFQNLGADADVVKARGLYQGTLWQYRWAPVFDLPWLVGQLGAARFDAELARFFADDLYNMTNQPDIQTPFLFAWRGHRTQSDTLVHRLLTQPVNHPYTNAGKRPTPWRGLSFALAPQGFADGMDDDAGGMTSWHVWASLGLYPLVPGRPDYVVICPAFDRMQVRVVGGWADIRRELGAHSTARWTGRGELSRALGTVLPHADLAKGGVLNVNCERGL
ncbi:MAG: glycosyl hydrolase family 92 [Novosphingobium sp. SCN 63-17]|uniref:glycoside hydrolase domain-containing protein n=2 Tax=Novosphingobium TaxID=165696 RepID=UPI00086C9FD2|nr:glycoside hydrolase domain-containing protein [Novosphingobium sp. 1748]MBN9144596.1 glycoside hydrolase family 92 protein [Novosphingobium sp.]ODU78784.1 MAG: glycosyl hydrolase family 92 [Novosphingobium sp. SCN 63-17]OJX93686.1 MAG: glycosyl hydrolase family 92 [Novosphingobium sp. 63-713]